MGFRPIPGAYSDMYAFVDMGIIEASPEHRLVTALSLSFYDNPFSDGFICFDHMDTL